jgi:hypothetical protein
MTTIRRFLLELISSTSWEFLGSGSAYGKAPLFLRFEVRLHVGPSSGSDEDKNGAVSPVASRNRIRLKPSRVFSERLRPLKRVHGQLIERSGVRRSAMYPTCTREGPVGAGHRSQQ